MVFKHLSIVTKFIIIPVLWLSLIFGLVIVKERFNDNHYLLLQISLYDPLDIMRGNYLALSYDINNINLDKVDYDSEIFYLDKAYVGLKVKDHKVIEVVSIKQSLPSFNDKDFVEGIVYIIGDIKNIEKNNIVIKYGIEEFFMQSDKAPQLEKSLLNNNQNNALAKIYVDINTGNIVLKNLIVNNQEY